MTAPIIVAMTWRAMFNNEAGWINYFLGLLDLPQPVWLGNPLPGHADGDHLGHVDRGLPSRPILLLAGLLAVSRELKEAAVTDGATRWQVFRHVTLPSIRPILFVVVLLKSIDEFRKFEGIQILTTGGPGIATTTLNLQIYDIGLFYDQVGYAAAYGVMMIAMIAASLPERSGGSGAQPLMAPRCRTTRRIVWLRTRC